MDFQIRAIREDELGPWGDAGAIAFGVQLAPEDIENMRPMVEIDRTFASFDGQEIVGVAAAVSLRMTVPGGRILPVAGISSMGVRPTHRRRGIATALMRRLLDQARERQEPLSALLASESNIYRRFGYGLASYDCSIDLETDRADFAPGYRGTGHVRLVSREEAIPILIEVYGRACHARPGMVEMDERWLRHFLHHHYGERDQAAFIAVHEGDEGPDAYAAYHVKDEWTAFPQLLLTADDVQAASPQAYADIWRYLLDVDLVSRVQAEGRPLDEPLMFLLDEPRRLRLTVHDGLWLRPVDIGSALAGRGYAGEGRIVLEIRDRFCTRNDGRWELEVASDGASCVSTDAEPDLSCGVDALGAAFLGGTSFGQLWRANQVSEERSGALARADALFASGPAPWCHSAPLH